MYKERKNEREINGQWKATPEKKDRKINHIYQPLLSGRIWHKVNFLSGV